MSDLELQNAIIGTLQQYPELATPILVKALYGESGKSSMINPTLYRMKGQGILNLRIESGNRNPRWSLVGTPASECPPTFQPNSPYTSTTPAPYQAPSPPNPVPLTEEEVQLYTRVYNVLLQHGEMRPIDVAKEVYGPGSSRSQINSVLYKMMNLGYVRKSCAVDNLNPYWSAVVYDNPQ